MARKRKGLDQNTTFVGIILGMLLGMLYAITRISKSGALRRRDLVELGGASLELEMETSISDAKAAAMQRLSNED